jgi:ABC-type multidrug transport system fused ATPase/permease subunit
MSEGVKEIKPVEKINSDNEQTQLSYSKKNNPMLSIGLIAVLVGLIWFYPIWYRFGFNLLMIGYFIFHEMRMATVFYATVLRIIMYPIGQIKKSSDKKVSKAEEELLKEMKGVENKLIVAEKKREWLGRHKWIAMFNWFYLCFYTINAVVIGSIFFKPFTYARVKEQLYLESIKFTFPLKTVGFIPLVGMVDLSKINMKLNFISAVGVGMVGLAEIVLNRKTSKRQLLMYGVMFPLGAFFLTMWVPSGFEFAFAIFALLTVLLIIGENLIKLRKKIQSPKS